MIHQWIPGWIAGAALLALSAAAEAQTIRNETTVETSEITLGDVVAGAGAQAGRFVAAAPAPGERLYLSPVTVSTAAEAAGLALDGTRPSRITVTRAGQPVLEEDLLLILGHELETRGHMDGNDRLRLFGSLQDWLMATEAHTSDIRVTSLVVDERTNRFRAALLLPDGGSGIAETLSGQIEAWDSVPVLARDITRGDIIREADITWDALPARSLGNRIVTDPSRLSGMTARRSLRAGDALRNTDVEIPKLVEKGDYAVVAVNAGPLTITGEAKALENGAMGDVIRLLNTDSNQTIEARVTGPGRVEIALRTATARQATEKSASR